MSPDDHSHATIPDAHIIRRHAAEGKSPTEIGKLLGITAQSVRNVLAGFAEKGQLVDAELQVLELLRQANCPDRKWPTAELLDAIGFSTKVRNTIERHCQWSAVAMLSLRDVFEFLVSDESSKNPGVVITPFLGFRNGGEIGFWEAVRRITELDLGESANAIWRLKFKRLEQANRIKGPERYAWSKPVQRGKVI